MSHDPAGPPPATERPARAEGPSPGHPSLIALTRFRIDDEAPEFRDQARDLLALFAGCEGMQGASLSRCVDEPLYLLESRWRSVGDYRRALGRVDVRMLLYPMSMTALNDPGTYTPVLAVEAGQVVAELDSDVVEGPWITAREASSGDWVGDGSEPEER